MGFYYRLTNHIHQMEESSHSFLTTGIVWLSLWLCVGCGEQRHNHILCVSSLAFSMVHSLGSLLMKAKILNKKRTKWHFDIHVIICSLAWSCKGFRIKAKHSVLHWAQVPFSFLCDWVSALAYNAWICFIFYQWFIPWA